MEIIKGKKTAIVLGATGVIGSHLIEHLSEHSAYEKIVTITRRKDHSNHPKIRNAVVDFDRLADFSAQFKGDDVFICLGTTRAKAGSDEAFRKVDFHYVRESARLAKEQGCKQCLLVSSAGADINSSLLYSRTKGEAEAAIKNLDFWSTHILQPSLLLGDRSEFRLGEKIGKIVFGGVNFLLGSALGSYQPVQAEAVAVAMINLAQKLQAGEFTHPSDEIVRLGSS